MLDDINDDSPEPFRPIMLIPTLQLCNLERQLAEVQLQLLEDHSIKVSADWPLGLKNSLKCLVHPSLSGLPDC